ncbi:hypothetical protein B0T18DRAFT_214428 [Schizothecium vesticola]|uniref:AT hook domain-containing protein n=1 Tax=Schizothecium vesticola TaxID=314040 RepID=A0AA40EJY8_9PEZI|nr:hypothetical protein B0T18DRAFT_214428 [Schizothecium vesticola]
MAPEREILDSEDEGSDFSPAKTQIADDANLYSREIYDQDLEPGHDPDDNTATNHSSLKSTDPVFFQRVYDEQQAAGTGASSLTSLVDPPPLRYKTKRTGASNLKEMANITQITTPSGEPGSRISNSWDVPSSPPPLPATASETPASLTKPSRTYGKRKLSSEQSANTSRDEIPPTQDPYAFPSTADQEPAPQVRKRMKRQAESSVPEENQEPNSKYDLPPVEDESVFTRQLSGRATLWDTSSASVFPDTYAAGLYIAPSALTASQKQQYQLVSLSSEPGPEPFFPAVLSDATQMQKSSCASTIAYPTPSRYAGGSFERTIDDIPSTEDVDVLPTIREPVMMDQPSSPDVIGEGPTRPKRARPQPTSGDGSFSSQTQVLKKRKTARSTQEDLLGPELWTPRPVDRIEEEVIQDETSQGGHGGEQHAALDPSPHESSGHRRTGRATRPSTKLTEAPSPPASTMDPLAYEEPEIATQAVEEPPPKKKRGRKKKELAPKEAVPDATMEEPQIGQAKEPEPEPEPAMEIPNVVKTQDDDTPKQRRGRPSKSAVAAQPIVIDLDSEPDVPADPVPPKEEEEPAPKPAAAPKAKAKAPAKRGRKKKQPAAAVAKSTEFVPEEEKEEETKPLSEISENMPSKPLSSGEKEIPASDDEDDGGDDHDAKLVAEEEMPRKVALAKDTTPVKEVAKPRLANPASSSSKGMVPLRVGLSRRSRIAPLLKSLKK